MTADCLNCGSVGVREIKHTGLIRCRESIKAERKRHKSKTRHNGMKPFDSCEVCGSTNNICYDHNHATGRHRGWLCRSCNVALGMAKDNPELLENLAKYLRERN